MNDAGDHKMGSMIAHDVAIVRVHDEFPYAVVGLAFVCGVLASIGMGFVRRAFHRA